MKKIVPAYILSFIISFLIWIYEPIVMYINNLEDLWFNFKIIIGPLLLMFIVTFIILSGFYTLLYYLTRKINKSIIYNIIVVISFLCFIVSYIQGNFLAYNLPQLDGTTIIWSSYKIDSVLSFVLWLIFIIIICLLLKKYKFDKVIMYCKYVSLAILIMLGVSFITVFLTSDLKKLNKPMYAFTEDNINDSSSNKNFYLFLVDSVDAREFDNVLQKNDYKKVFNDFTFYKDTVSAYGFTRDSIPFILSGIWNENKTDFMTYYNNSMDKSPLIERLKKDNYNINLYSMDNIWNTNEVKKINNVTNSNIILGKRIFYTQEIKYILYKYLPFFLKKYSKIETMDFNRTKFINSSSSFNWNDKYMYNLFKNEKLKIIENNNFSFLHLEGAHVPFDIDENFNTIKDGTYDDKIVATIKLVDAFLTRLKDNNVYNNSVIIILADHGFNYNEFHGRQNPILLIKGLNEHHDFSYSSIPVSYEYLQDVYNDLLDGKKSTDLFKNIDKNKPRRFMWYWLYKENHMVEYEQSGKAWDLDTLKPTGKEFNR